MATRPHVVFLPYPIKSHSIPVLHFVKRLNAFGVTITFINAFEHMAQEDFAAVGGLENVRVVGLGGLPQPGDEVGPLPMIAASERIQGDLEQLMEQLNSTPGLAPPVCIISDMFLGWTQDVADKYKISKYVLFTSPSSWLATMAYVPTLQVQGRLPVGDEPFNDIPGVPPTKASDMPSILVDYKEIPEIYDFLLRNSAYMPEASGVLINSFYELEHKSIEGVRSQIFGPTSPKGQRSVLPIGPTLPSAYFTDDIPSTQLQHPEERAPYLQWLDNQPKSSTLFLSFGSVSSLRAAQITALATGLEASGQKFLWVVHPPAAVDGHDPLNPGLPSSEYLPEGFANRMKDQGFLVPGWVQQLEILSHPAVGGFLSHCGWNSTLESLCKGVPLLAWPLRAEQKMTARFLVDEAGAALEFERGPNGIVEGEEVARVVRQLMFEEEGKAVRSRVAKWRDLARSALSPGGSSYKNLQAFVHEITAL